MLAQIKNIMRHMRALDFKSLIEIHFPFMKDNLVKCLTCVYIHNVPHLERL